jgi:hypothetical protein
MSDGDQSPGSPQVHSVPGYPLPSATPVVDETGWPVGSVMARRARAFSNASSVWVTCRFVSVAVVEVCFLVPLGEWFSDDDAARGAVFYGNRIDSGDPTFLPMLVWVGLLIVVFVVIRPTGKRSTAVIPVFSAGLVCISGAVVASSFLGKAYPPTGVGLPVLAGVATLVSACALFPPPRPVAVRLSLAVLWVVVWAWSGMMGQAAAGASGWIARSTNPQSERDMGWLLIIGSVLMFFAVLPCLSPRSWLRLSSSPGSPQPDPYDHLPDPRHR